MFKYQQPVSSYGIIAFSKDNYNMYNNNVANVIRKQCELPPVGFGYNDYSINNRCRYRILMIQRKHSMGYNDFIRGRYFDNNIDEILRVYLSEMTFEEREKIRILTFEELWDDLWSNRRNLYYKNDKKESKIKFSKLDIEKLLSETSTCHYFSEFGIPKGRKNSGESELECAKREFKEETNYSEKDYKILNIEPIEEIFYGTNNVKYRHVYFLAIMNDNIENPSVDMKNYKQMEEVKNIDFFTFTDALKILRPYDREKRKAIIEAYDKICKIETKIS
jgi:ADP-ribose pyrophosphatase YjhB (NUDIX family)